MMIAWVLTLPAAAVVGAGAESVVGLGDWGTGVVAVLLIGASVAIWRVSRRQVIDHTNVTGHEAPAEVLTPTAPTASTPQGAPEAPAVTPVLPAVTPLPAVTVTENLTATIHTPAPSPAPVILPVIDQATPPAAAV
jgi:PiT family inorganic phosphate transporter